MSEKIKFLWKKNLSTKIPTVTTESKILRKNELEITKTKTSSDISL